ncbi:hypothetical protein AAHE18_07G088500 [Arachis hypogaea]
MKVVSCVRGELLSIVGLYGRISRGLRGGGLPCGGCQWFESAYLQLHPIFPIRQFDLCYDLLFMDVDKILPSSSTLGWHSLQVKGEVQTRKGLWWIPRHPETRKGVVSDEMLRGVENKPRGKESKSDSHSSGERNGSSLNRENGVVGELYKRRAARRSVAESITSLRSDPSSMGHVESRVNQQGPPCKAKYSWVTDSEVVP